LGYLALYNPPKSEAIPTERFAIAIITLIIPYTPLASVLGFQALPLSFVLILMAIVALYVTVAEIVKGIFYSRIRF
jgi:Mg2+-importing ATPase